MSHLVNVRTVIQLQTFRGQVERLCIAAPRDLNYVSPGAYRIHLLQIHFTYCQGGHFLRVNDLVKKRRGRGVLHKRFCHSKHLHSLLQRTAGIIKHLVAQCKPLFKSTRINLWKAFNFCVEYIYSGRSCPPLPCRMTYIKTRNNCVDPSFNSVSEQFLGSFAKCGKATISFVISVHLSAPPHGTTRLPLNGFSWNFIFEDFSKICSEKLKFL